MLRLFRLGKIVLSWALGLSISACASYVADTNQDPNYNLSFRNLGVVEALGPISFAASFNESLVSDLRACAVSTTFLHSLPGSGNTDSSDLTAEGERLDATLTIALQKTTTLTHYGIPEPQPSTYTYLMTLRNKDQREEWKAFFTLAAGRILMSDKGEVMAGDMIEVMQKDQLLMKCAVSRN